MLLDTISQEAVQAAKKMDLDPHTSAVTKIDDVFVAIEDLRLKNHESSAHFVKNVPTTVVARIPHIGLFGIVSNQIIGEITYSFTPNDYMRVEPSPHFQMSSELFGAMLKYVETIAWINNLNGMIFDAPLSFINTSKAKELLRLDYHTGHYIQEGIDPIVSIEKNKTQPFTFKSDYLGLYAQAGGKKIKTKKSSQNDSEITETKEKN